MTLKNVKKLYRRNLIGTTQKVVIIRECYDGLIKSYDLDKSLFSTYDKVYSLKRSQKDKDKDEDPSARSDRGLKKWKTSKDAKLTKGPKTKESKSGSSKGTKSQSKSFGKHVHAEEPEFEKLNWDNPKGGDYPFDLTKPLPLVMNGNRQIILIDYFFNNDLKYLQGGILTMTYTTSITKTKAAQYDF
uniref:Putative reverse transcriptase domain-containing protein n=1 Tax=Tanacetum cinerariifolium TaxID=118510 RepID=A0A6L2JM43_TANCI|nr:putative reverse transcriptase domain-containing protein [Tanacetum cinerariifolium]